MQVSLNALCALLQSKDRIANQISIASMCLANLIEITSTSLIIGWIIMIPRCISHALKQSKHLSKILIYLANLRQIPLNCQPQLSAIST